MSSQDFLYASPAYSQSCLRYPPSPSDCSQSSSDLSSRSSSYLSDPSPSYHATEHRPPAYHPQQHGTSHSNNRVNIAHPYARLFAKKEEVKRRKIWNHALEKALFNPYELSVDYASQLMSVLTNTFCMSFLPDQHWVPHIAAPSTSPAWRPTLISFMPSC